MSGNTIFVFILIGFVAVLMAGNRVRFDHVALMVVLAVSPFPFAVAILIAASAAFVTPVSIPVVESKAVRI